LCTVDGEREAIIANLQPPGIFPLDLLQVPAVRQDHEGCILEANGAARDFLSEGDLEHRFLANALRAGSGFSMLLAAFFSDRHKMDAVIAEQGIGPSGEERCVEVMLCRTGSGQALAFLRDVTLAAREAKYARLVDRLVSIGKLAGGTAHDLNNILMVITSYTALLEKRLPASGVEPRFLQEIKKAVGRAVALTDQLLAFARRQSLQPKTLDLTRFIEDRRDRLAGLAGPCARMEFILSDRLPAVEADPEKLVLVLDHLTSNARDALSSDGNIIIETSEFQADAGTLNAFPLMPPGRYAALTFTDTGSGMPPEVRDRIFEPFFTTKPKGKGTGMGMAMVYGIVKQSGGFIYCSSELEIGTTLQIFLPAVEGTAEAKAEAVGEPSADAEEVRGRGRAVLVIEDEEAVLSSMGIILKTAGFQVLAAGSGEDACALAGGLERPPELIISDVVLPGMDGRQAVEKILDASPGIPVIYMSGYSDNVISKHGIVPADVHYLPKPFDVQTLMRKIREVLGE
jgi:two-component system, cell cycle sensor histidine kinase and response regulator CckA